jgi:Flp pilus assembly pilin Flp
MNWVKNFLREERGQDLVEYTLLIVAAAFTGLALYNQLGPALNTEWNATAKQIGSAQTINLGS